jgi:hypothetical protein
MSADGRVLIVDFVLRPANEPDIGRLFDLEMLVVTDGGKERTKAEFERVLNAAGLRLNRLVPLGGSSLLEARAA